MTRITLNVPQGVGDTFWIYQKFAPHVDRIDFRLMWYGHASLEIQARATDWLRMLPKVGSVEPIEVAPRRYERTWTSRFPMRAIFERAASGWTDADYGCNRPLEQGVRLEAIDSDYSIQESVPLPDSDVPGLPARYVTVYVPWAVVQPDVTERGMWSVPDWATFVRTLYKIQKTSLPVVVLGALYDERASRALADRLREDGLDVRVHTSLAPAGAVRVLRGSTFFAGHQSGLGIVADNLDVPQVMLYMPTLDRLRLSWPKRVNVAHGVYQSGLFSESPEIVAERVSVRRILPV